MVPGSRDWLVQSEQLVGAADRVALHMLVVGLSVARGEWIVVSGLADVVEQFGQRYVGILRGSVRRRRGGRGRRSGNR